MRTGENLTSHGGKLPSDSSTPNANINHSSSAPNDASPTTIAQESSCNTSHAATSTINTSIECSDTSGMLTNISHTLAASLKWVPTSEQELAKAESELLSTLTRPFKTYFVDIGPGWGSDSNKIRTLEMLDSKDEADRTNVSADNSKALKQSDISQNHHHNKLPLVLIHGFAAGIGTWILNLDPLSASINRKVYAIDILGFARSSRAPFDLSGDVEGQFIDSIERWRSAMGIEKFILMGHSFGGYLSASYALKHSERVSHVILADPWGIQDRQATVGRKTNTYRFPIWVRVVNSIFQAFNPLAVLRVTGPYGPSLVQKFRADLREKFRPKLQDDCHKFLNYIYHCNAQKATGESAFKALTLPYGWPKNPLIHRLLDLNESVSLTFIYGSRSWIEKAPGEFLRDCLAPNRVTVNEIEGSGHHVYADKYNEFNEFVREACAKIPN